MTGPTPATIVVEPAGWSLASALHSVLASAIDALDLAVELASCRLVADAIAADDRAWFRLVQEGTRWHVTIWLHPDQVLADRPDRGVHAEARPWRLDEVPRQAEDDSPEEFSLPNAQRFVYQQLLLVSDVIEGRLDPDAVPPSLIEAFQEAWLVTVDGRLQRRGHPHLSAAERRTAFLRRFGPAGILTPSHWGIFNALWKGDLGEQKAVLAKVRLLPPLDRRRRGGAST